MFDGDWVLYQRAVFGSDLANGIELTVGKDNADITFIDIYLDSLNTTPIASVEVPNTGGWYNWQTISVDFPVVNDVHDILLGFRNDNTTSAVTNVESFRFLQNNKCTITNHHGLTPIEAEDYCEMSGVEILENVPGSWIVGAIENNDYVAYGNVDFGAETINSIVVSASAVTDGGTIEVRKDSPNGEVITTVKISNTGSLDAYKNFTPSQPFSLSGNNNIFLVFKGGNGTLFNVDVFEFEYNLCKETFFDGFSTIQAEDFCQSYGIGTETISGSNLAVNAIQNNDYVAFGSVDFGNASASKLTIRTASQTAGGTLEVRSGGIYGELITTIAIGGTGNWKTYQEYESTEAFSITGLHDLYFVFKVESGYICNMDEFTFSGDACEVISHDGLAPIEAEDFCDMSGIATEVLSGDNLAVNHIQANDYIGFGNVDFGSSSVNRLTVQASSQTNGGNIELRLGSSTGTLITTLEITGTGNWGTYQEFSSTETFELTGLQDIYLVFTNAAGYIANLDVIEFSHEIITTVSSENEEGINLYPNPTSGKVNLSSDQAYRVLNSVGQVLLTGNNNEIDLSDFESGLYLIQIAGKSQMIIKE